MNSIAPSIQDAISGSTGAAGAGHSNSCDTYNNSPDDSDSQGACLPMLSWWGLFSAHVVHTASAESVRGMVTQLVEDRVGQLAGGSMDRSVLHSPPFRSGDWHQWQPAVSHEKQQKCAMEATEGSETVSAAGLLEASSTSTGHK